MGKVRWEVWCDWSNRRIICYIACPNFAGSKSNIN